MADSTALGEETGQSRLTHHRLLGQRLYLHAWARFLVVFAMAGGACFARYVVGIDGLDVPRLVALAGLLLIFNIGVFSVVYPYRQPSDDPRAQRFLAALMHITIVADFIFLTVALWFVGGTKSPFVAFYLLHVILAAVIMSRLAACIHAAIGYAMLTGLVLGEALGLLPQYSPVGAVSGANTPLDFRFAVTVLVVQGLLMALSLFFLTSLTDLLRQGERRLQSANTELERLSAMRRDFLHIALHNLKSPVAAVSMLLRNFELGSESPLSQAQEHWLDRCQIRLKGVSTFLRDLDMLAALESGALNTQARELNLHTLLRDAAEEHRDLARERNHVLDVELPDVLPPVHGVDRLIREAVVNLITNAIKYTPDGGHVVVRAMACDTAVRIEVEDNGIGIAPEDQERLFKEFSRIKRDDTALSKVEGSGLGLSIVRRIIEAHGGTVTVESHNNKGSVFGMELPA